MDSIWQSQSELTRVKKFATCFLRHEKNNSLEVSTTGFYILDSYLLIGVYSTEREPRLYIDSKTKAKGYIERFIRDGFAEAMRKGYLYEPIVYDYEYGKRIVFKGTGEFKIELVYRQIFRDKEDPDYYLCEDIINSPMKIYARKYVIEV